VLFGLIIFTRTKSICYLLYALSTSYDSEEECASVFPRDEIRLCRNYDEPIKLLEAQAKMLTWLAANNDQWAERCCHHRTTLRAQRTKNAFTRLDVSCESQTILKQSSYGGMLLFRGGTTRKEREDENAPSRGDVLLFVDNTDIRATNMSLDDVKNELRHRFSSGRSVLLVFMRSTAVDIIFEDPVCAISLGLLPVLRHMVENDYVGINDRVVGASQWNRNVERRPLFYYAETDSPDTSCFEYLLSLPDIEIDCFLLQASLSSRGLPSTTTSMLDLLLQHPRTPDVNTPDVFGCTTLHSLSLCIPFNDVTLAKMRLLINNGANPLLKSMDGRLPLDMFYGYAEVGMRIYNEGPYVQEMAEVLSMAMVDKQNEGTALQHLRHGRMFVRCVPKSWRSFCIRIRSRMRCR